MRTLSPGEKEEGVAGSTPIEYHALLNSCRRKEKNKSVLSIEHGGKKRYLSSGTRGSTKGLGSRDEGALASVRKDIYQKRPLENRKMGGQQQNLSLERKVSYRCLRLRLEEKKQGRLPS